MNGSDRELLTRVEGCLLGAVVGDSLGGRVEGMQVGAVRDRYPDSASLAALTPGAYGAATEMTVAVAESLAEFPDFSGPDMARRLCARRSAGRAYGQGTVTALERLGRGAAWNEAGLAVGGVGRTSYGNGAAIRSAPVGLLFGDDVDMLRWVAEEGAGITHAHTLGAEGAVLHALAVATALASAGRELSPAGFLLTIGAEAQQREFRSRYENAAQLAGGEPSTRRIVDKLGNGSTSLGSVVTAAYCFATHATSFVDAVTVALSLGGSAAAVASMTGAIGGAYLGRSAIPQPWVEGFAEDAIGPGTLTALARRLVSVRGA